MPRWIFVLAFALVFYGNGAVFIESFVNYPSWHLIGAAEFPAYHAFIGPRVIRLLVAPALLLWMATRAVALPESEAQPSTRVGIP